MPRAFFCLAALLAALLLSPGQALAHKANLFAYVEGGAIKGQGYFASGDKAKDCPVLLKDGQGRELASTRTDSEGGFSLPLPATPRPWRLVLDAGQGHQAAFSLRAEEGTPTFADAWAAQAAPAGEGDGMGISPAQLEQVVGRALERRLEPVKAQLARLESEGSFGLRDIVGGVGYILGLMGLAAYLKARRV